MEGLAATLITGAVLGLASALHCATMCGGISAGLLSLWGDGSAASRARILAAMQAGRVTSYVVLGSLVGLAGQTAFGLLLAPHLAALILKWAAAVSLMWIGLSIAGLVPSLATLSGPLMTLGTAMNPLFVPFRRTRHLAAYATGLSWAACPCPMVYGALFTAALTGSLLGGATLMTGFGLGTIPAVAATALGYRSLARLDQGPMLRVAIGLSIAAFGFATVYLKVPFAGICLTP